MVKTLFAVVLLAAGPAALAQTGSAPAQNPQPQPQPQPQAQPSSPPQSGTGSTAGSQGQSSTAQPGSPGASSQQVVVNPPPSQQPQTAQASPPSSTTVVNPPPSATYVSPGYAQSEVVVERERRNPMMTVATDAAYGGLAGILVGFGVALVNQWDHWERDITVGAGAGVLVGAAVGAAQAAYDASQDRRRVASDGLNRTDKDPVIARGPAFALALRF
jgi:hypothetical protein